jgi:hypothetical protein
MSDLLSKATNKIKSIQVSPLPIGSGGNNPTKQLMNNTNLQLSMLTAQAVADTKYDPPIPEPVTKQVIKETFVSEAQIPTVLMIIGSLLVVFGIVTK